MFLSTLSQILVAHNASYDEETNFVATNESLRFCHLTPIETEIKSEEDTLVNLFLGFTEFTFELKRQAFKQNVIVEFPTHPLILFLYSTVELLGWAKDDSDECLLAKLPHDCFISY